MSDHSTTSKPQGAAAAKNSQHQEANAKAIATSPLIAFQPEKSGSEHHNDDHRILVDFSATTVSLDPLIFINRRESISTKARSWRKRRWMAPYNLEDGR